MRSLTTCVQGLEHRARVAWSAKAAVFASWVLWVSGAQAGDPFPRSVAALSMPFASRGFVVKPDELFNGEWRLTISVTPGPVRSAPAGALQFDPDGAPIA